MMDHYANSQVLVIALLLICMYYFVDELKIIQYVYYLYYNHQKNIQYIINDAWIIIIYLLAV